MTPVPLSIVQRVVGYVRSERNDAEKYDNRTPLDDSGVYSLHALTQQVYAEGWEAGYFAALESVRGLK